MDEFKTRRWLQIALINFCIVALAGVTLRYKINFALPIINHIYYMPIPILRLSAGSVLL